MNTDNFYDVIAQPCAPQRKIWHPSEVPGIDLVKDYPDKWFRTGSSVICVPPVLDTDIDIVIIYSEELDNDLYKAGYTHSKGGVPYHNESVIRCYRLGVFNLISVSEAAFEKWRLYTKLATYMNLTGKEQRVALAQFITEGRVRGTDILYADGN